MIRVFLVCPIAVFCEGLRALFADREDVDLIGIAADVQGAARELRACGALPDVILFDFSRPDTHDSAGWLIEELPDARIVAIGVSDRESELVACAESGVSGFVTCQSSLSELIGSVEAVCRNELLCSPMAAAALLRRVSIVAHDHPYPTSLLTIREQEILELLGEGLSNKQIAERLYIAVPTVRNHVHNILGKLSLHRRAEAAALLARRSRPAS
jgi:DNA-binding NarL/FixJ family response regulator